MFMCPCNEPLERIKSSVCSGVGGGILAGTKSSCGQKMAGASLHKGVGVGFFPFSVAQTGHLQGKTVEPMASSACGWVELPVRAWEILF